MNAQQKKIFLVLLLLSALYFVLFISPNLTGAQDANMLSVFEVDEYAQYPNVIRMLTPGDTFYQSIRNFAVYEHYFYGYPFYFFSALVLFPLKWITGAGWVNNTPLIVATLRQMINVLPMIISLLLLVFIQTRFKSWWRSLGLFILLLSVPVIIVNNLWWHPDSLVFLFVVLTFFFLDRDDLRFGWNFYLAAAACGLAVGTKYLGAFFVLAIPLYLIWGIAARTLTWLRGVLLGALFVVVMAAAVVISNPLLLLPIERGEIIATQVWQFQQTSVGIILANTEPLFKLGEYPEDLRVHYGEWFFMLLALIGLVIGLVRPQKRRLNALILAWMVPFTITIAMMGTRRTHYFLPVLLPLFSTLINYFPSGGFSLDGLKNRPALGTALRRLVPAAAAVIIGVQFVLFLRTDANIYATQLNRENDAPSIASYRQMDQQVFSRLEGLHLTIYHDWRIYLPPHSGLREEMNWDMATYPYIQELSPDLILLERENVALFSEADVVQKAVNPGNMQLIHEFYRDAGEDQLPGYHLVYHDHFGYALVKQDLYQKYFQP
ncbi:MAG: hypothetical protein GYA59_17070 [Chloroflexi bacterium]|nr:hypothetical protein [Chloroflexota bacterium]